MEIRICENRKEWDDWFLKQEHGEFLQSFDWGKFQGLAGKPVLRLQLVENNQVVWQGQGFEHKLGMGMKYLYMPRLQVEDLRFKNVCDFLKNEGFTFLRIESINAINLQSSILNLKFTHNRQPQTTLILDLTQPEESILGNMHSKTRYNINLSERKGVQIKIEKNIEVFWKLNQATTERDAFKSHDKEYYQKMLATNFCHQITAYYNYRPIASVILIVFGDTCTYLHGASANEYRNLMAPYLLQWEAIKFGKKLGCKFYDFWGISPKVQEGETETCFNGFCWKVDHKWTGVTRFKTGFGGVVREYPKAFDLVLNKWKYLIYKLIKKILNKF